MLCSKAAFLVSRSLSTSSSLNAPVQNVTIIGAGLMGSGIAQVSASAKLNVVLVDTSEDALKKAKSSIDKSIARVAKKKFPDNAEQQKSLIDGTMKYLTTSTNTAKAVANADLVIEAIVENIEIKRKLFAEVEANVKSSAIITSNTSSLQLRDIAANIKNKSQFGGLHFFNPVPVMKLLEVVRHDETSDATFDSLMAYGKAVGKTTVKCKDTPGFIVNRLLIPYMTEAFKMADRGDASYQDIDIGMKLGAGYPMGPFELADYVGLDTLHFISQGWAKNFPNEKSFQPSPTLEKLVKAGKLGRKSGEGFYKY